MNKNVVHGLLTLLSCCAVFGTARRASACGGAFTPTPQPGSVATPVVGHRMAFAVSDDRTVLWDQIQYQGDPADFSWVLPVLPGAYLEASRDSWFESLDAVTTARISAPVLKCVPTPPGSGCGCGAGGDDDSAVVPGSGDNTHGVTVLHAGTVGPYDTLTLASTDGDTLTTWLDDHGYAVPDDVAPIIAEYVAEGFDFIALRLQPGAGVQQMTPVRVVTPGPRGPLPLRMVAAGIGDSVAITLYLIGEARYALPDFHESSLDLGALSWDFASSMTNYASLERRAFSESFGASYLTTFADQGAFAKQYSDADNVLIRYTEPNPPTPSPSTQSVSTLSGLYFSQSSQNAGKANACPSVNAALLSTIPVSEMAANGFQPATNFDCGAFDDMGAAMIGMQPANVWLTRVEMNLPRSALSADCIVEPSSSQEVVSNVIRASKYTHPPAECAQPLFEAGLVGSSRRDVALWAAALALGFVSRLRRWRSGR